MTTAITTASADGHRSEPPIANPTVDWEIKSSGEIDVSVTTEEVRVSSGKEPLTSYDRSDGTPKWQAEVGQGPHITSDDQIFVCDFNNDWSNDDGTHAFTATDGSRIWSSSISGKPIRAGTNTVGDRHLYLTDWETVYALDRETGTEAWRFLPSNERARIFTGLHNDEILFTDDNNGNIIALNSEDGAVRWEFESGFTNWVRPRVVVDGALYASSYAGIVFKLDSKTGEIIWRTKTGDPSANGNAVHAKLLVDDFVYAVNGSPNQLTALDPDTGDIVWTNTSVSSYTVTTGPNTIYMVQSGVHAVDKSDGSVRWESSLMGSVTALRHRDDKVYVTGEDAIYCLNPGDGSEVWRIDDPSNSSHFDRVAWGNDSLSDPMIVYSEGGLHNDGRIYSITDRSAIGANVADNIPTAGVLSGGFAMTAALSVAAYRRLSDSSEPTTLTEWLRPGRDAANTATAPDYRAVQPDADSAWQAGSHETTAPVFADDIVVTGRADGTVIARDAQTGEQLWRTSVGETIPTTPAIEFSSVYAACRTALVALNLQSGTIDWRLSLTGVAAGTPLPHDDRLYVACEDGTVLAVNAKSGDEQWQASIPAAAAHGPAIADGQVVVSTTESTVAAFDTASGDTNWTVEVQGDRLSAPVVVDRTVYVADHEGTLHALDAGEGGVRWTRETGVVRPKRVAVADGRVWVAGEEGSLVEVDTEEEPPTTAWSEEFKGPLRGPVVVDETVYVGSEKSFSGLAAESGEERWRLKLDRRATGLAPTSTALYVGTAAGLVGYRDQSASEEWGESAIKEEPDQESKETGKEPAESEVAQPDPKAPASPPTEAKGAATADTLTTEIGALDELALLAEDDALVTYCGKHAEIEGEVRVLTLSDPSEPAAEVFQQTVLGWVNGSSHPNAVTIHDWGMEPRPWVATKSAGDWKTLAERPNLLDFDRTIAVLTDAAEGLRNVALYNTSHHNLSPRHIWVARQDDEAVGKVDEWGLNRAVREATGETVVTPYTAPEQVSDADSQPQKATDIYGLGAVAYRVLTERDPVVDEREAILTGDIAPPSEVADVPEGLDEPLLRALEADPADRYDSMHVFKRALDNAL